MTEERKQGHSKLVYDKATRTIVTVRTEATGLPQEPALAVQEGVFCDEQGYWILRDGSGFFQRKDVNRATDKPLTHTERDMIALCQTVIALRAAYEKERREWIPVSERLPEQPHGKLLVTNNIDARDAFGFMSHRQPKAKAASGRRR